MTFLIIRTSNSCVFIFPVFWFPRLGCVPLWYYVGPTLPDVPFHSVQISVSYSGPLLKYCLNILFFYFSFCPNSHVTSFNISSMHRRCFHSHLAYVNRLQHSWRTSNPEPWESFSWKTFFFLITIRE